MSSHAIYAANSSNLGMCLKKFMSKTLERWRLRWYLDLPCSHYVICIHFRNSNIMDQQLIDALDDLWRYDNDTVMMTGSRLPYVHCGDGGDASELPVTNKHIEYIKSVSMKLSDSVYECNDTVRVVSRGGGDDVIDTRMIRTVCDKLRLKFEEFDLNSIEKRLLLLSGDGGGDANWCTTSPCTGITILHILPTVSTQTEISIKVIDLYGVMMH